MRNNSKDVLGCLDGASCFNKAPGVLERQRGTLGKLFGQPDVVRSVNAGCGAGNQEDRPDELRMCQKRHDERGFEPGRPDRAKIRLILNRTIRSSPLINAPLEAGERSRAAIEGSTDDTGPAEPA